MNFIRDALLFVFIVIRAVALLGDEEVVQVVVGEDGEEEWGGDALALRLTLEVINPILLPGEPLGFIVRLENVSDKVVYTTPFGFNNISNPRFERDDGTVFHSSAYRLSGFPMIDFAPVEIVPGGYLENSFYYPYIYDEIGGFHGKFKVALSMGSKKSNSVDIEVLPSDNSEIEAVMIEEVVHDAVMGYTYNPEAVRMLREVAESGVESKYVEIARFLLARVESGIDRWKTSGDYYVSPYCCLPRSDSSSGPSFALEFLLARSPEEFVDRVDPDGALKVVAVEVPFPWEEDARFLDVSVEDQERWRAAWKESVANYGFEKAKAFAEEKLSEEFPFELLSQRNVEGGRSRVEAGEAAGVRSLLIGPWGIALLALVGIGWGVYCFRRRV